MQLIYILTKSHIQCFKIILKLTEFILIKKTNMLKIYVRTYDKIKINIYCLCKIYNLLEY